MHKILSTVLLTLATSLCGKVIAQTDAENLDHAREALSVVHNCDDAIRFLSLVSIDTRSSADYLLCMARAQDCKTNNEQALYYYNKYLGVKPSDDSVKKRVAELSDLKNHKDKVDNEERTVSVTYRAASGHRKRHKGLNLNDNFNSIGMSGGLGTGGADAPFKSAISLNIIDGIPIIHDKVLLEFDGHSSFLLAPDNTWFSNAYQNGTQPLSGTNRGYSEGRSEEHTS